MWGPTSGDHDRVMTFLILILASSLAVVVAALVRTIASDGYGLRPPPPSHHHDLPPRWV